MFAAFRKMINIISHKITAGSRRCCPELITDGLFPPQKSHHHFNLLQVQRTERPLIQSLYFAISALHEIHMISASFSPGFHAQRGSPSAALCCGCDAHFWISMMWDHLLVQAGAAGVKTLTEALSEVSLQAIPASDACVSLLTFSFNVFKFLEEQLRGPLVTTSTG